ncbi:MAG: glycoside hydrolase family 3 C-terminal domain-containing protein [Bacteroidia bacterium]|nr:glycoside hydrolase family 3 C-terminal domain-containing protein [Bacteroidia bacterium]
MNKILLVLIVMFGLWQCNSNTKTDSKSKAKQLLSQMTLEEKAGQMTQLTIEMISQFKDETIVEPHALDTAKLRNVIVNLGVGSILNVGGHTYTLSHWTEIQNAIHAYEKESRLQVPVLYGIDAIHGANYTVGSTLYPQQLALAASFNTDMAYQMANMVASDVRASGIPWNFSPVLDVGRNPKWPRFWETFGEDPYLVSQMGVAMVNGYQAPVGDNRAGVAACLKHYVGYSNPVNGHDRTPAYIPEKQLREIYLLPFAKAIQAGAKTIMINSSEVNGEPVHASTFLLKTILRDELHFEGITVTDWEDIKNLCDRHKVAATYKEAVALAINAGIDLAMVPLDLDFTKYLIENVKEGKIKEQRIDEAVLRILALKEELGLFEPSANKMGSYVAPGSEESKRLSYELATQSIVLLQNKQQALPLAETEKILVTGPNANYINALNGGWTHTWQGRDTNYNSKVATVYQALKMRSVEGMVKYLGGNTYTEHLAKQDLLSAANGINTVVLCLGEDTYTEKPGDIDDLDLSSAQQELIKIYKEAGKKVIVVLLEGRPRTFATTASLCDAIVFAGLPGDNGGMALADLLKGSINFSAKLPFTFPRLPGIHKTYDCKYTETLNNDFKPLGFTPLFEFGSGISYTQFTYLGIELMSKEAKTTDSVEVKVKLENSGDREGTEIVLLYSSDMYASITPSIKRLRAFKRVVLKPKEIQEVHFKLAVSELAFVGLNNQFIVEPGKFIFSTTSVQDTLNITP